MKKVLLSIGSMFFLGIFSCSNKTQDIPDFDKLELLAKNIEANDSNDSKIDSEDTSDEYDIELTKSIKLMPLFDKKKELTAYSISIGNETVIMSMKNKNIERELEIDETIIGEIIDTKELMISLDEVKFGIKNIAEDKQNGFLIFLGNKAFKFYRKNGNIFEMKEAVSK